MMGVTTSFIKGEVAASNHEQKKSFPPWKQQEGNHKQNFKKRGFQNQQRKDVILNKRAQTEQWKGTAQGEKEERNLQEGQSISHPNDEEEGTEGLMIIEAEIGGHCIHCMLPYLYNEIIGRPRVKKLHVVLSTAHGMLKLPVEGGVITLKRSRLVLLECALVSQPEETLPATKPIMEDRVKVAINPEYSKQAVMIGSTLIEGGCNKLYALLQRNLDIFSWKPVDMTGVLRHITEHRLNVREGCSSIRQKKKGQAADRNQAIQEEVGKLVEARIIKEVHYHDWLYNPMMVKKHDGSWRMCVDFKDLNKACMKDGYLLPERDWKVESLCGFPFKCFLDAYKGYHQIQMEKEDDEKTTFITSQGIFCYTKMPFGVRNAGVTYQRLLDKAFHKHIGRNLEVYMDDLVIERRIEDEIVRDIEETFKTLNMKLNPKKCTFGVEEGMFLGFKVNTKGLKVCPDKVDDVLSLPSLKCLKDVQKLNGKLASLNRSGRGVQANEIANSIVSHADRTDGKEGTYRLFGGSQRNEEDSPDFLMEVEEELPEPWILFTDGSSCTDGSRAGLILINPEGMEFTYALRFRFDTINNEAEYEALIVGLRIAEQIGVKNPQVNVDSRLVANQVNGTQVLRSENKKADALSKIASKSFAHLSKNVLVEELKEKSISEVEIQAVAEEEEDTLMTPIFKYLTEETLPADVKKSRERLSQIMENKDNPFKDWCEKLCIHQRFASVKHPQTNGLVEKANRSLGEGIKARLDARSKIWMEELPHVLWAHRTMIKSSNRDTQFLLTYEIKAVIPSKIDMPTLRTVKVDIVQNDEALGINLEL
uniref:Reverse transcriptase domain-containing protein n=1 Tax=Tanacetum cinerariifolium TaxID=118510 RepID=A0A6L2ND79_TANCI|nr:reverse transcriptase domain-containing protein [Tanacetum cinerariifolium]